MRARGVTCSSGDALAVLDKRIPEIKFDNAAFGDAVDFLRDVAEANGSTGAAAFQLSQKANSLHEVISRFALDRRGVGEEFRRISLPGQRCNLGRIVDLSVTGIQIESDTFFSDVGSAATVSFEHDGSAYRAEGKVRWVKGAGKFRRLGIQFDAPVERFRPLVENPDAILC
jgi:hypothetical protein